MGSVSSIPGNSTATYATVESFAVVSELCHFGDSDSVIGDLELRLHDLFEYSLTDLR
jgi:hypothetical protein